ncbi:MAG: bifunctional phosphopantothenoylcysteine decarboxylase/phosphopantothenate synthase [Hormoscilla sp. GM7CHS1pb]|nr:bifunctional phosphopantothenoylcysteine decarboxylase/phosphopantothenate synthase [Hormoscilla sp. GM7CHS1pb]
MERVLIGITGSIAAYKVCEVLSTLAKAGVEVRAIVTIGAREFITPLTVATLCRHQAYIDEDFWQPLHGRPLHIELGEWAQILAIAPLTANTLAKLTYGLADNLLTNTVLASTCPILLAPAMNTDMWSQQAVQRNWQELLRDNRYHSAGMGTGILACDRPADFRFRSAHPCCAQDATQQGGRSRKRPKNRVGAGRMAEPADIITHIYSLLHTGGKRDLAGKRVLIGAGGTREHLDPVRFIGNPATGKMGLALARAAVHRGATVTLVHAGLSSLPALEMKTISVVSAAEMRSHLLNCFPEADITIMAAAVADVKPVACASEKLPKKLLPSALELEPVPDLIAELAAMKQPHQRLIGFAAQTGDIVKPAWEKLQRKKLDAIAANQIDLPNAGFGGDTNQAIFLDATGRQQEIPASSKLEMAHHLFDFIHTLC